MYVCIVMIIIISCFSIKKKQFVENYDTKEMVGEMRVNKLLI